jgi:hypothetical protein
MVEEDWSTKVRGSVAYEGISTENGIRGAEIADGREVGTVGIKGLENAISMQ